MHGSAGAARQVAGLALCLEIGGALATSAAGAATSALDRRGVGERLERPRLLKRAPRRPYVQRGQRGQKRECDCSSDGSLDGCRRLDAQDDRCKPSRRAIGFGAR
jgi:hypothetical protein